MSFTSFDGSVTSVPYPFRLKMAKVQLSEDPITHLEGGFVEDYGDTVLVRDLCLYSICEHHLIPFVGKAHVGYLPNGRVAGLSKLARVVDGYARRPQLQERLTSQIAHALYEGLNSLGSIVVIEAEHLCMTARGVHKPGSTTVTSAVRGVFEKEASRREEVVDLISQRSR